MSNNPGWTPELVQTLIKAVQDQHRISRELVEVLRDTHTSLTKLNIELVHFRTAQERLDRLERLVVALATPPASVDTNGGGT